MTTDDGKTASDLSNVTVQCKPIGPKTHGICQTTVLPSADSGASACASNADCPANLVCAFPETPACSVTGQCVVPSVVGCNAYSPGCACDGTETSVVCTGLPNGYLAKPLRHKGVCVDGG